MRPLYRAALAATGTAAVALAFLAPGTIHAEDETEILHTFLSPSYETELPGGVVGNGEVVHDPHAKSGWGIEVTLANPTEARQTARVTVVLQRSFFNPEGRVSSTPYDVWGSGATADLAPHETVKRVLPLPASLGTEIDSSNTLAHAKALAVARAEARGEQPPVWAMGIEGAPRRSYHVVLR
jgi:hypothetical protein